MDSATTVVFVVLLVATIVAVDVLFFRHQFWKRLLANIAIALAFIVFFLCFLRR